MKILALNSFKTNSLNFKSNEYNNKYSFSDYDDDWYAADDIEGAKLRDAIRASMYGQLLISDRKLPDYAETLDDVYILNLQNIGSNSYKGATLANNVEYLDLLDNSNIYTVIDLAGFDNLQTECKKRNINYFSYPIKPDFWSNPIFIDDNVLLDKKICELQKKSLTQEKIAPEIDRFKAEVKAARADFLKDFETLLNVISKGNFYISCELGEDRTPNILALSTYFNPGWKGDKIEPTRNSVRNCIKNMYNNLTEDDKLKLGFTEEFENELKEKLQTKTDNT